MNIGRFVKTSLSVWKGRNSCVIEVRGSLLRCPELCDPVLFSEDGACIDESEVFDYILSHGDALDGVTVAGGEPFAQKDLYPFLKKLKALKKPIQVRTEGMFPDSVDDLAGACMFDLVTVSVPCRGFTAEEKERFDRTLEVLGNSDTEYEIAVYVCEGCTSSGLVKDIAKSVGASGRMSIVSAKCESKPLKKKEALALYESARKYLKKVELRGF
ncbi:MAG: hypothetical protein J5707_04455 [Candidatus Methanomethylophilus sp.]|nr:hypothetical protein [Methanomethylophilus sp.]